jgi:hypothetical protein
MPEHGILLTQTLYLSTEKSPFQGRTGPVETLFAGSVENFARVENIENRSDCPSNTFPKIPETGISLAPTLL